MTNQNHLLTLVLCLLSGILMGQATGRLQVEADLDILAALDPTIEVSVIDLASNTEMMRNEIEEAFRYSFPLNGRYLLYFRKEGYGTTRLMVDTHTFMSGIYSISFNLIMDKNEASEDERSIPIGTIKFDRYSTNFGYQAANQQLSKTISVLYSMRDSEIVSF